MKRDREAVETNGKNVQKRRKLSSKFTPTLAECGHKDLLDIEAKGLISRPRPTDAPSVELETSHGEVRPDTGRRRGQERQVFEVYVEELSSTGDGLARHPARDHVFAIPFALPGDRVNIKAFEPSEEDIWSNADFVEAIEPSELRAGTKPKCKYFAQCGGCQFQMISYDEQLKYKKTVVENAFRYFSGLDPEQVPPIGDTGASPLQYGYRTKLTPHFDGPRKGERLSVDKPPPIGFMRKGFRQTMDIESCPIATDIVQDGLRHERSKTIKKIDTYKRGATILLRETTDRTFDKGESNGGGNADSVFAKTDSPFPGGALELGSLPLQSTSQSQPPHIPEIVNNYVYKPTTDPSAPPTTIREKKLYTTENDTFATEHIGSYIFKPAPAPSSRTITPSCPHPTQPIKYLLDAYCGSGLFAITLSPLFTSVLGIELDPWGVTSARENARLNGVEHAGFIEADAAALFQDVPYPAENTVLVIDPPRKGCSTDFLKQLLRYGPARVVYVSCNVGSQARDVGCLVRGWCGEDWWKEVEGREDEGKEVGSFRYEIEELRGFDFFPQTSHVEGLCVLRRVVNEAWKEPENEPEQEQPEKQLE
ncbi:tRNA (uracil(54)-C(5))-methyltransferase [Cyphellophora attinorum]|uniref:tRNA (Uracil(54)-C(5))-methyltransferase n=1 Tax=Cyphellophora attinorum TaxID=1664694 RepID=A0A0N1GY60_9EURO|nr:tRNA (uracil(54)-C(5))-methyltransferase [Phialophora attinorum]KPI35484.1 tRNA (uracil(54)-C(5))-methyltransferase [Phialophora attinorum]